MSFAMALPPLLKVIDIDLPIQKKWIGVMMYSVNVRGGILDDPYIKEQIQKSEPEEPEFSEVR